MAGHQGSSTFSLDKKLQPGKQSVTVILFWKDGTTSKRKGKRQSCILFFATFTEVILISLNEIPLHKKILYQRTQALSFLLSLHNTSQCCYNSFCLQQKVCSSFSTENTYKRFQDQQTNIYLSNFQILCQGFRIWKSNSPYYFQKIKGYYILLFFRGSFTRIQNFCAAAPM